MEPSPGAVALQPVVAGRFHRGTFVPASAAHSATWPGSPPGTSPGPDLPHGYPRGWRGVSGRSRIEVRDSDRTAPRTPRAIHAGTRASGLHRWTWSPSPPTCILSGPFIPSRCEVPNPRLQVGVRDTYLLSDCFPSIDGGERDPSPGLSRDSGFY